MKAKKALKRLTKVEALLCNVIDQFPASKQELGELLDSAKAAVIRAKEMVNSQSMTTAAKKPPARAEIVQQTGVIADGSQRVPLAAAERRAVAKRKGMNAVRVRRLRKTA
jgi:hypothetical protein